MMIYTATQIIAPSGVLRHAESRHIATLGAWIQAETRGFSPPFVVVTVYAATHPTGPFGVAKHIL